MTISGNRSLPTTSANIETFVSSLLGIQVFYFILFSGYVVKEDSVCFSKKDILWWVVLYLCLILDYL